jgi:hypothetical protein
MNWRRALAEVVAFGLLGVIATAVVAWIGAVDVQLNKRPPTKYVTLDPTKIDDWPAWFPTYGNWRVLVRDRPQSLSAIEEVRSWCFVRREWSTWVDGHPPPPPRTFIDYIGPGTVKQGVVSDECGFPFRAFAMQGGQGPGLSTWAAPIARAPGIDGGVGPISLFSSAPVVIPVIPMWPGVAIDAGIYGAGLFALWRGVRLVRPARARGLQRCSKCGYDLSGLTSRMCPECGAGAE